MPKISTKVIRVSTKDIDQTYNMQINYNQDDLFYSEVPEGFQEAFEVLTEKEQKKLSVKKKFKHKYSTSGPYSLIVFSDKEVNIEGLMKKVIETLLAFTVKKMPVIVIEYDTKNSNDNRWGGDSDLPTVGLTLSATYCHELETGDGKKYYKYWQSERPNFMNEVPEKETVRTEINVDKESTVIPDSPENRKFVEDLHKALFVLTDKISAVTETSQKVLEAIAQKQNMLTV